MPHRSAPTQGGAAESVAPPRNPAASCSCFVSVALTEQLAHEYRRFRSDQPNWLPLQPPAAVREVAMVEADEPEAAAAGVQGGGELVGEDCEV